MTNDKKHNPANDFIIKLKNHNATDNLSKALWIKYNKNMFLTNIDSKDNVSFDDVQFVKEYFDIDIRNDNLALIPNDKWLEQSINLCPKITIDADTLNELSNRSYVHVLHAHLHFNFYDDTWSNELRKLSHLIIKSLYTKSLSIKSACIDKAFEEYYQIKIDRFLPRIIIYAMIYMVWEFDEG